MRKLGKHEDSIEALAVSPDGSFVVACDGGLALRWSTTAEPTVMLYEPAAQVAVSPDGKWIAIGTPSGGLARADVATNEIRVLRPHSDMDGGIGLQSLAISPDGSRVALSGGNEEVEILDASDGHCVWLGRTHKFPYSVRWRGNDLVVGAWNGSLYIVDAASIANGVESLEAYDPIETGEPVMPIFDLRVDGDRVTIARGESPVLSLWDTVRGERLASVDGEHGMHAIAFSPDGHTFAAGGNDQAVAIYARDSLEKLGSITIVTPGDDNAGSDVRDYYDATGPATVRALAFAPDGTKVYVGLQDGRLIELAVKEIIAGGIANIAMYEARVTRALEDAAKTRVDIVVPSLDDSPAPAPKKAAAKPKRVEKKPAAKAKRAEKKPAPQPKKARRHKGAKAQRALGTEKPTTRKKSAANKKPAAKKNPAAKKKPASKKPKTKR